MTARLGMSVAQKGLSVTGQNISNISTVGYTRQRLDQVSLNVGGGSNRYSSKFSTNIGNGALVNRVAQVRDPFLDRRYRKELGKVGEYDRWLAGLDELAGVLDEVTLTEEGGGINKQLQDLQSKLDKLSSNVGNGEFDTMVKSSAESLVKLLNSAASSLEGLKETQIEDIEQIDIPDINNILKNIQQLNLSIRNSEIHGNEALELRDQRNLLIDDLATYFNIEVRYTDEKISDATSVEKLTINLVKSDGTKIDLINDDEARQFKIEEDAATGKWNLSVSPQTYKSEDIENITDTFVQITADELGTGSIKSALNLLNNGGEFDNPPTTKGIPYYQKSLDLLAQQLATTLNDANNLKGTGNDMTGHDLFESNDGNPITAANIMVATGWANNSYGITASQDPNAPSGDNTNITHMISLMKESMKFMAPDPTNPAGTGNQIFEGTFQEFFVNMGITLGLDQDSTADVLKNHVSMASSISDDRDNVSGVSLDEEGMNMLQYGKAYSAAARLMTTLDEALDTLINKMGVVGR